MPTPLAPSYRGHRFPAEIIGHAVWLYFRCSLSFRAVEELLAARGMVTYDTVRQWCLKFGQAAATDLRRRRAQPGDNWHLAAGFLKINGKPHYLWRAVDHDGNVLDILVQSRRNKAAAKKVFRKLLKGNQIGVLRRFAAPAAAKKVFRKLLKGCPYVPRGLITAKLGSDAAAKPEVLPSVAHRRHKRLNNRAANSPQPTRQRERRVPSGWRRCTSAGHAQRCLATCGPIREHFCPRRHRRKAAAYRQERAQRFLGWSAVIGMAMTA